MAADLLADVLIVGGGLAGLRAAEAAAGEGVRTIVVSKRPAGEAGASARASGGLAAATGTDDSADAHLADILKGGCQVSDSRLAGLVAERASRALHELSRIASGFPIDPAGHLIGNKVPAHNAPRSVQYPHGMRNLLSALRERLDALGVTFLEHHHAAAWQRDGEGSVSGLQLFDGSGLLNCAAKSVVLATGGCGQLFPVTSNGPDLTGDGYALALRAGCALRDMEFIQYTPTAFAAPDALKGQTIVGTLLTVDGVCLLNANGERFMERYEPERFEASDRATLARAVYREIAEGRGSVSGGVFLDATCMQPEDFNLHRPGFYDMCISHGVDPASEPLQTAPSAHTCLGGIAVDERMRAAPNIFVAGEALGGTHGANRLSSNSLTEANVTGWAAGRAAADNAGSRSTIGSISEETPALRCLPAGEVRGLRAELVSIMGKGGRR